MLNLCVSMTLRMVMALKRFGYYAYVWGCSLQLEACTHYASRESSTFSGVAHLPVVRYNAIKTILILQWLRNVASHFGESAILLTLACCA